MTIETNITFTEAACAYIQQMIAKQQGKGLRLSIKKTGCSGFSYAPSIVETINPNDLVFEACHGKKIFVDVAWLHLLQGLQIDYVEEHKNGLKQKQLVFTNPNESSRCGCGESFHVE